MAWAICILVFGSAINTITAAAAAVHAERLRTRSALFFSIRALSIPACNRSRPASGIVIFSYSSFNCFNCSCSFISILHLSGLFGPVMLSLCLYLSYVLHIYDVGVKISRLCCLRIAQPVLPSRFSRSFFITRYSLLFTVFRFSFSIFAISSSCLSSKNLRTTMARSFGSRFSIARFKSIFS